MVLQPDMSLHFEKTRPVNFSRPSIDVTMKSVAHQLGEKALGIILTGANVDGADGLREIHTRGGICIIQEENEAMYSQMPAAARAFVPQAKTLKIREIAEVLQSFTK